LLLRFYLEGYTKGTSLLLGAPLEYRWNRRWSTAGIAAGVPLESPLECRP
jgi:hypothetical protein